VWRDAKPASWVRRRVVEVMMLREAVE
jgi:hypothetical protein